ncbi:MAG TPA: S41 family peptidase [Symbiobacteriaceae bacterium]|nr:S41 family peptidase [Symbiobacteriaceae bacterium]
MKVWLAAAGLLLFLALPFILAVADRPSQPAPPAEVTATIPDVLSAEQREAIFLDMWSQVDRNYLYWGRRTVDWSAVKEKYLPLARNAESVGAFRTVLKQALAEVEDGHVALIDPEGSVGRPHVWVEPDGDQLAIAWVDAGSDAAKAGLKAGMLLQTIDGLGAAEAWAREEAAASATMAPTRKWLGGRNVLRGPFGSSTMVVASFPGQAPVTATLVRDAQVDAYSSLFEKKVLPGGIVYIALRSFGHPEVLQPAKTALLDVARREPPGLIMDVRYNRGGNSESVTDFSQVLFPKSTILGFRQDNRTGQKVALTTTAATLAYEGPLVVLTNQSCGSACDLFVLSLQQKERAVLVGETPCGAGIRGELHILPNGFQMSLSSPSEMLDRQGQPIEQNPAQVDYRVAPTAADWAAGRDPVLEKAVELLQAP